MILDSIENSKRFEVLHPLLKPAFDYIKSTDFTKMEDGKYEFGENGIMSVTISSFNGKSKTDAFIEAHKKYIDIQVPLLGIEKIGWKPGDQLMEVSVPYNEAEDLTFYIDRPTAFTRTCARHRTRIHPQSGNQDPR